MAKEKRQVVLDIEYNVGMLFVREHMHTLALSQCKQVVVFILLSYNLFEQSISFCFVSYYFCLNSRFVELACAPFFSPRFKPIYFQWGQRNDIRNMAVVLTFYLSL